MTRLRCPGPLGSCSPVCPLVTLCRVCGVLGHLAPVHWCARLLRCVACAVSWASWLLFTGALARCVALCLRCPWPLGSCSPVSPLGVMCRVVVSRVRCPGPLGSCSPVCRLVVLCCVCGVLGHLAPVHWCARPLRCVACAVSWASWLLFTGALARCVVVCVRCPGPLGSCSPVCPLGVLCRVVASRVRCLGPLGSCSPASPLLVFCPVCGVLGHLAPVH